MDNDITVVIPKSQAQGFKDFLLSLGVWSVEIVELGGQANLQGLIVPAHITALARSLAVQLARLNLAAAHHRQMGAHSGGRQSPAGIDGSVLALFPRVER